jgi:hypothetical protein
MKPSQLTDGSYPFLCHPTEDSYQLTPDHSVEMWRDTGGLWETVSLLHMRPLFSTVPLDVYRSRQEPCAEYRGFIRHSKLFIKGSSVAQDDIERAVEFLGRFSA